MRAITDFVKGLLGPVHPVLAENRRHFENFDQSLPLEKYDFVVCDTELTGLNRRRDEIISIGAVKIHNLRIALSETFHSLVRPTNLNPNIATFVHRLTPQQLQQAPPIAEVLPDFVRFCGPALLVGHCVGLDMHFLNKAARIVLGGTLSNPSVDTMRLAQGYKRARHTYGYGNQQLWGPYDLDSLSRQFNLVRFKAHDALEDALQTAYLFLFLVKKFRQRGVVSLKDLYRAGRRWPL